MFDIWVFSDIEAGGAVGGLVIKFSGDAEGFREFGGAIDTLDAPNQNRGGIIFWPGHDIQHPMHPIDEVDIPNAASGKHRFGPFGSPLRRVASQITWTDIRFRFRNHQFLIALN